MFWPLLLGALAFLVVLAAGAVQIGPDSYLHVGVGRWILSHGHVPTHDPFSFTRHGVPWVAQEWGAEVLMAALFSCTGWSGLVFSVAALFGLTVAQLTSFLCPRMGALRAVCLSLLSAWMMHSYIMVRPEEIVWPLMALWVGMLIDASEKSRAPSRWLWVVMFLWANLHGSFILGLGLALVIAVEAIFNAPEQRNRLAWQWTVFLVGAVGCALANPQGWKLLAFPFHLLGMRVLDRWTEWMPPDLQRPQVLYVWLSVVIGLSFAGRIKLPILRAILLIGLILFALQHVRNISLLGLIGCFLLAAPLGTLWRDASLVGRHVSVADAGSGGRVSLRKFSASIATLLLVVGLGLAVVNVRKPRPILMFTPATGLNVLLSERPHARILNDSVFGGYLIYRGIPVFVDSRVTVYGDAFIGRYLDALEMIPGEAMGALLDKYRINAVLIAPGWPVARFLDRLPRWKKIYVGKVAVVYVLRGASRRASAGAEALRARNAA